MKEVSIGEILMVFIYNLIAQDYDFSLASKRREALHNFCAIHKDKGFKPEKIRTYFRKKLNECLKEKGQDLRATGAGKRKPVREFSDMEGEIIPEPQPEPTPIQPTSTVIETYESQISELKPLQIESLNESFDEESVSSFFEACWLITQQFNEFIEPLSEKEKKILGPMWLSTFRKYLTEKRAIAVKLVITFGMLAPKLAKARRIKKEKQGQKKHNDSSSMP